MVLRALVFIACSLTIAFQASAHESRPAYLQLTQSESGTVDVLFKVPALGDLRLGLYATLPERCALIAPPVARIIDGAYTERATYECRGGLIGQSVLIDGLSGTLTDVLVRVERGDGAVQVERLTPAAPSFVVQDTPGALQVASTYLMLGIEHILFGIDHLLFVLALVLIVTGWRRLVKTVTAFTVAHSITLAGATLGWLSMPQEPVEAIIALSIVFVAGEIVHIRQGRPGIAQRWPWLVAFVFGLLHGFGFAGALSEVGLPQQSIPLALLLFNVGVEVGQLAFIAAILAPLAMLRAVRLSWPTWASQVSAYGIGTIAVYWTVERTVGFWS